ncbi:MAG: hypothetical protein PSV40_13550 [Polaromonas sp.]|nr:hypothetical protein [Polaromonas sp.]MDI1270111.1 hypothetical protein [Polaromonas sp.]
MLDPTLLSPRQTAVEVGATPAFALCGLMEAARKRPDASRSGC